MKKRKKWFVLLLLFSPVIIYLLYILAGCLRNISYEDILSLVPENKFFAMGIILILYGLKSLTVFFPIVALNIAVGMIYPYKYSFIINFAGSVIAVTVPYILGMVCSEKWAAKLSDKYDKIQKIEEYRCENQLIFTYLTRAVGFLPCDILSWYMGNRRMNYLQYVAGSLLGMLPAMILNTIFGDKLKNGLTWEIAVFAVILFAVSFIISYFSNKAMKKLKK